MALLAGEKVPASAGVAESLGTGTTEYVVVQAKLENAGIILVGTSTTQSYELVAGASVGLPLTDLSQLYVESSSSGDGVNFLGTV